MRNERTNLVRSRIESQPQKLSTRSCLQVRVTEPGFEDLYKLGYPRKGAVGRAKAWFNRRFGGALYKLRGIVNTRQLVQKCTAIDSELRG